MEEIKVVLNRHCSDGRVQYYSVTDHKTEPRTYSIQGEQVWDAWKLNEILAAARVKYDVINYLHNESKGTFLLNIKEKSA